MQIHLTPPLIIQTLNGRSLELLPVVMAGLPTSDPKVFIEFLKLRGKRIPIDEVESDKCQRYMRLLIHLNILCCSWSTLRRKFSPIAYSAVTDHLFRKSLITCFQFGA
jgi:hypothetical protein